MLGNMNRAVPSVHKPNDTVSDVKPTPSALPNITSIMNRRRDGSSAALGFGLAYSGLTGIGGTIGRGFSLAAGLAAGALSAASAFDIGPGFTPVRASARMLPVSFGPALAGAAGDAFAAGAAFGAALAAAAGFAAGAGFGAAGLATAGAAPACFSARAEANISATLGRAPPAAFGAAGFAGFGAGASAAAASGAAAATVSAAGSLDGAALASTSAPLESDFRAAARISATDNFFFSAMPNSPQARGNRCDLTNPNKLRACDERISIKGAWPPVGPQAYPP